MIQTTRQKTLRRSRATSLGCLDSRRSMNSRSDWAMRQRQLSKRSSRF